LSTKDLPVGRLAKFLCLLALLGGGLVACQRKDQAAAAPSPTPAPAQAVASAASPSSPATVAAASPTPAPAISGSVTPALVSETPESITHFLHYPKDPESSKMDDAVQFFCEIAETGEVESTHALVGNHAAFRDAVQNALDWGRFTPATVNGKAVRSYLGGTVIFLHQNGEEVIVVSLATYDRDRVGKLQNYIQPQVVGGIRHPLEKVISSLTKGVLVGGRAEVIVNVDDKGVVTGTSGVTENPKGSGLGDLLNNAVKQAQFTPAYENGKPVAGGINVVADFTQF
jgi:hypothetical protein